MGRCFNAKKSRFVNTFFILKKWILTAWAVLMFCIIQANGQNDSDVLIINSYHHGYVWSDGEMTGLLKTLTGKYPSLLPAIEYLDWKRHPAPEQEKRFLDLLRQKYTDKLLRVVVTLDDKAFELALNHREIFGRSPIVFGGINRFEPSVYGAALTNFTGVAESKDYYRTLDLILRLQPHVREIVGYHDDSESALAHRYALEEVIHKDFPQLHLRFIENWSKAELLSQLSRLPSDCAVFSLGATRDRKGRLLSDDTEFLKEVAEKSSVPVYQLSEPVVPPFSNAGWEDGVWCGVGGSLISGERHGEQVGKRVIRILEGESVDNIPVCTNSAGRLAVNWNLMKRFNLSFDALPEDTEIYNQPVNFYRIHKSRILLGGCIIIILIGIVFGLIMTIIYRRRMERENARLAAAVEQSDDAIIMLDTEMQVSYLNPAFSRMTGWNEEEVRSSSLLSCLEVAKEKQSFAQAMRTIQSNNSYSERLKCRCKDGGSRQLILSGTPVREATGKLVAYILIARDVTREVNLEEQVRNAQKMEAIGLLAGGVAHDFNNLLQVIMGHTQLAMDFSDSEAEQRASLQHIMETAKRGADLPRQLLTFGRRQPIDVKDTNLNDFVANSIKMLRKLIGTHIDINFCPTPDIGNVHVDEGQLSQVIMNLSINARDAMSDTGELTFHIQNTSFNESFCDEHVWAREGDFVQLSISDTGSGMDQQTQERIFEPFFTTKSAEKGTGLGLSVVYGIVKQHDGLIHLESTPGKGTTFDLYLPRKEQRTPTHTIPSATIGTETKARGTILIAEDEARVRTISLQILSKAGYEVLEAENGLAAIERFKENADTIDLILLDMIMPKMRGPEVADRITEICPDIPILYSSGYSSDWANLDTSKTQKTQLIQKPYDRETLLAKVAAMLAQRELN